MAEVQKAVESGEMTQRFIEFVMMQAQHAALFMGQAPDPRGEQPEINLDLARMFIDQLVMIREKTRGNLSSEELQMLNGVLSNLQLAFVEVSRKEGAPIAPPPAEAAAAVSPEAAAGVSADATASAAEGQPAAESKPEAPVEEGRKKFSKSYGS